MTTPRRPPRLSLIFDADDTLWHNNVLFENVIQRYFDWLAHPTLDRAQLRAVLAEVELANARAGGYGARAFLRNLAETFEKLMAKPVSPAQAAELEVLAEALLRHDIELMPEVPAVLGELGGRHDLYLLTKGDAQEQQRKVDASGLAGHFLAVHIVPEKEPAVYREVAALHGLDPASTWMIGNSPRSDILPARAAGMNAVYIPHEQAWWLDHADLAADDGRILRLPRFSALREHF